MSTNAWLKVIFVVWVLGFLVLACGPAIAADGIGGTLIGGAFGLILAGALGIPWVLGVALLLFLIWLTNPRGRGRGRDDRSRDELDLDDRYPR